MKPAKVKNQFSRNTGNGTAPPAKQKPSLSLDKVTEAFGNIPGAVRLVWDASAWATLVMAAITLVSALLPASQAYVGKLIVDSVFNRDYAVVQGVVLVTASTYIVLNLLADIAYFAVNPRLRS